MCPHGPCSGRGGEGWKGVRARNRKRKRGSLEAGGHVSAPPAAPYSHNSEEAGDSKFKPGFQVLLKL